MAKKKQPRFYLLTLGCPKNQVDSEGMSELLVGGGYLPTENPDHAEVLIVNTCGFLEAAKAEAVGALQELAAAKRPGQALVAAGCMVQRFGPDLAREVPGLDGLIGTRSWPDILPFLQKVHHSRRQEPVFHLPETGEVPVDSVALSRAVSGPRASAYLKISDGCSAPCAFCTIPDIKGLGRSDGRRVNFSWISHVDRSYYAYPLSAGSKNGLQQIGGSGFAVRSGDAHHGEVLRWEAVESVCNPSKSNSGIGDSQCGYIWHRVEPFFHDNGVGTTVNSLGDKVVTIPLLASDGYENISFGHLPAVVSKT